MLMSRYQDQRDNTAIDYAYFKADLDNLTRQIREESKGYPGGAAGAGAGVTPPGGLIGKETHSRQPIGAGQSTGPKARFEGTDEERKALYEILDHYPDMKD